MKRTIITAAVLGLAAITPQLASAADGKISFTGSLTDVTCSIGPGAGASGGADMTVNLPTLSVKALAGVGSRAGSTPFSVVIGGAGETGCTNGKIASIRWEPAGSPQIDATTGRLNNAGSAAGVQVSVWNNNGQEINLYQNSNPSVATIVNNTATLQYVAEYYAAQGGVGPGSVDTFAVYSMSYN